MAENSPKTNTGILAKAQKRLSRTKTKVLQNLGKADKTKDETFNNNVTQIEELQERTHPLQKELNHYMNCVKNLCHASNSLHNSFQTVYEDGWPGKELIQEELTTYDLLWNDYLQNLQDSVMVPLNNFLHHFPAFKAKISKRGRKLVDYDNTRHQLDVLNLAKKRDDLKIEKAEGDMREAKRIYEEFNQELLMEMPAFYNSRCHVISNLFTSLFGAEFVFHSEIGKLRASMGDTCNKLASQSEPMNLKLNTSLSVNNENGMSGLSTPVAQSPLEPTINDHQNPQYSNQTILEEQKKEQEDVNGGDDSDDNNEDDDDDDDDDESKNDSVSEQRLSTEVVQLHREDSASRITNADKAKEDSSYVKCDDNEGDDDGDHASKEKDDGNLYEEPASPIIPVKENGLENGKMDKEGEEQEEDSNDDNDDDNEDSVYTDTPINTPVHQAPAGTIFQVQATHRYQGEDVDELNFEPGEVIYVIEFECPDEQDDGWLMGVKQSDGIKGVFPENFTRKI